MLFPVSPENQYPLHPRMLTAVAEAYKQSGNGSPIWLIKNAVRGASGYEPALVFKTLDGEELGFAEDPELGVRVFRSSDNVLGGIAKADRSRAAILAFRKAYEDPNGQ